MACRLLGAKPSSEPMVTYCQVDPWDQIVVKLNWNNLHVRKLNWKCLLKNGGHFSTSMCYVASLLWKIEIANMSTNVTGFKIYMVSNISNGKTAIRSKIRSKFVFEYFVTIYRNVVANTQLLEDIVLPFHKWKHSTGRKLFRWKFFAFHYHFKIFTYCACV